VPLILTKRQEEDAVPGAGVEDEAPLLLWLPQQTIPKFCLQKEKRKKKQQRLRPLRGGVEEGVHVHVVYGQGLLF
jgi:hypothetical protein